MSERNTHDKIFATVNGDGKYTKEDLKKLLETVQNAISETKVFPFWIDPCMRWAEKFERNLGNLSSPWITQPPLMQARPYMTIGGHAYIVIGLAGGTSIIIDNGYFDFGMGKFQVIFPNDKK